MERSYSTGKIETAGSNIGGLIGYAYVCGTGSSTDGYGGLFVYNCFSTGEINGNDNVGGLIGTLYRTWGYRGNAFVNIANVYTTGKIQAQNVSGALIGKYLGAEATRGSLTVTNSYWVPDTTGISTSEYGTAKELNKMFNASEFPKFDFVNIWKIEEGVSMPYLKALDKPDSVNK